MEVVRMQEMNTDEPLVEVPILVKRCQKGQIHGASRGA